MYSYFHILVRLLRTSEVTQLVPVVIYGGNIQLGFYEFPGSFK